MCYYYMKRDLSARLLFNFVQLEKREREKENIRVFK